MVFFVASLFNATNPPPSVQFQPPNTSLVIIPKGSSLQGHVSLIPQNITVVIGSNNTVMWRNEDSSAVSIVSDTGYIDRLSGPFDTTRSDSLPGGYIPPGKTFNFTFTEPGVYAYHGIPHPWVRGTVVVALIEK